MKKSRKIFAATLALITLLGAISGCGNKNASNGDVQTVTIWTGNGHDKEFMTKKIDEWNNAEGKKLGVKIEYVVQEGGSMSEKLDLAFESGSAPDMFTGGNLKQLIAEDKIVAIDDLPGGDKLIEKYKPYLTKDVFEHDGKIYHLPIGVTTYGLIYNKDMFKAAGIVDENGEPTPPETLDELVEYAKRLTNPEKKEYGIVFPAKFTYWYDNDITKVASASDGLPSGYNPVTGQYDLSAQAEVMKALMKIKQDKSYLPGADGLDNDPARARFALGGIGMKTAGSYDYGVFTEQFPAEIDWGVAPFPTVSKNQKYRQFMNATSFLKINKATVERVGGDKIMAIYEWFLGDEMTKAYYENGLYLPLSMDFVKGAKLPEGMENWEAFAKLTDVSVTFVPGKAFDLAGQKGMDGVWLEDIWTEKIPINKIDDTVKEVENRYNEGIKKYCEDHPEYNPDDYVVSDWDARKAR